MSDWSELKRMAEEATPGRNFDRLPSAGGGLKYTCTGDDGSLVLRVDHKNDEFGFIGERGREDEAFFLACTPAAILALIAENERLSRFEEAYKEWIDKTEWVQDSAAAKDLGKHRADVMNERINQLRAEVEGLKEQLRQAHPFKFSEQGPSQRCMACGEYHYGPGNLPCPKMTPVAYQAVPANCRQRLAAEGKAYPRSSCAACGAFSPKWRDCDAAIGKDHGNV